MEEAPATRVVELEGDLLGAVCGRKCVDRAASQNVMHLAGGLEGDHRDTGVVHAQSDLLRVSIDELRGPGAGYERAAESNDTNDEEETEKRSTS